MARLPSAPRGPLGASVTLSEATAPVKLPTRRCPRFLQLEPRPQKGGISPLAPAPPQRHLLRLPPILRISGPGSTPSYSKAPRGLFVQSRVTRIFTRTSISPDPPSRQRPSRCAIRAGRNLPDKEFRYLRTVIVTAAVHRGFGSGLISPPLNLPAPGRRQPLYVASQLLQGPVFLLNSRLGLFSAAPLRSTGKPLHATGHPFSLSYGVNLPSSLTRDHPSASGLSPPPTCVGLRYGHPKTSLEAFLGGQARPGRTPSRVYSPSPLGSARPRISLWPLPTGLDAASPSLRRTYPPRHPFTQTVLPRYGNFNPLSFTLRSSPHRLRPD